MSDKTAPKKLTLDDVKRAEALPRAKTGLKAGPTRRKELDHVGAYNVA